jgi:hypothetical protein
MGKRGDCMECAMVTLIILAICLFFIITKRGGGKRGIIRRVYVERDDDYDDERYEQRGSYRDDIIHTKVAGVTFQNDDGTSRQAIVKSLRPGEQLFLRHVPIPGHPEAIQVITYQGRQVGHLSSEMAPKVLKWFKNYAVYVYVTGITGGTWDKPTRGCNIVLQLRK